MGVETKTIEFEWIDDTDQRTYIEGTFEPAEGELWYVDTVTLLSKGTALDGDTEETYRAGVSFVPNGATDLIDESNVNAVSGGRTNALWGDSVNDTVLSVGRYLTGGQTLYIYSQGETYLTDTYPEFVTLVTLRRVL